jgi:hypothetical protein
MPVFLFSLKFNLTLIFLSFKRHVWNKWKEKLPSLLIDLKLDWYSTCWSFSTFFSFKLIKFSSQFVHSLFYGFWQTILHPFNVDHGETSTASKFGKNFGFEFVCAWLPIFCIMCVVFGCYVSGLSCCLCQNILWFIRFTCWNYFSKAWQA